MSGSDAHFGNTYHTAWVIGTVIETDKWSRTDSERRNRCSEPPKSPRKNNLNTVHLAVERHAALQKRWCGQPHGAFCALPGIPSASGQLFKLYLRGS